MDFLKDLFGDVPVTYDGFLKALETHNSANKDNQIKIANIASGEYVSKEKYAAKEKELEKATNQIKDLNDTVKKSDGDVQKLNDDLKQKQKEYEKSITTLKNDHLINSEINKFFKDNPLKDSKYESLLRNQIKTDLLKVDNEQVIGLSDQTKQLTEGYADLFGNPTPKGNPPADPINNFKGQLNSFEAIEKNADNMTVEQVAEAFSNLDK